MRSGIDSHDSRIVQNTAVSGDGLVEVFLVLYPERDDKVNIEIALTELQIRLRNLGAVRCNKDTHDVVLDFVAQTVGFVFVERDDEIAQAVDVVLKRLTWFQEVNRRRNHPTKHSRGVFVELVEHQRQTERRSERINRGVGADRHENIRRLLYLFSDELLGVGSVLHVDYLVFV